MLPPSLWSRRFPFRWPKVPRMFEQRTLAPRLRGCSFESLPHPGAFKYHSMCFSIRACYKPRSYFCRWCALRIISHVLFWWGIYSSNFFLWFGLRARIYCTMNFRCAFYLQSFSGDSESKPGNHRVRTKYEHLGYEIFRFGWFWKMNWGFEVPE